MMMLAGLAFVDVRRLLESVDCCSALLPSARDKCSSTTPQTVPLPSTEYGKAAVDRAPQLAQDDTVAADTAAAISASHPFSPLTPCRIAHLSAHRLHTNERTTSINNSTQVGSVQSAATHPVMCRSRALASAHRECSTKPWRQRPIPYAALVRRPGLGSSS